MLKCSKVWQNSHLLVVWQVASAASSPDSSTNSQLPKKFFLIINGDQNHRGISLSLNKPDGVGGDAAFVNLLRKHLPTPLITGVWLETATRDLWIGLHAGSTRGLDPRRQPNWWIELTSATPPELRLINAEARECLIRWSSAGTFTKRKPFDGSLPNVDTSEWTDLLTDLMGQLASPAPTPPSDSPPPKAPNPPDTSLGRRLARRLKTLRRALQETTDIAARHADGDRARLEAGWLQAIAHEVSPGATHITISADVTGIDGPDITIALDPRLTVGENIDRLYKRWHKARRGSRETSERATTLRDEIQSLETTIARVRSSPISEIEARQLEKRYSIPPTQTAPTIAAPDARLPWRVYAPVPGVQLLVGKSADDNDTLTRAAKADEYWIHTVTTPGSHVIARRDRAVGGNKPDLPSEIARAGAILAIHHSPLRGDHAGEVYITRRANIRKRREAPPGLWDVTRSDRLFVRYTDEELKRVLDTLEAR